MQHDTCLLAKPREESVYKPISFHIINITVLDATGGLVHFKSMFKLDLVVQLLYLTLIKFLCDLCFRLDTSLPLLFDCFQNFYSYLWTGNRFVQICVFILCCGAS